MKVLAYDIVEDPEWAAANSVTYVDKETLLRESDAVTLHVPLTEQTHKMMAADEFAQMKAGSYILNTCRGPVIDEASLVAALHVRPPRRCRYRCL